MVNWICKSPQTPADTARSERGGLFHAGSTSDSGYSLPVSGTPSVIEMIKIGLEAAHQGGIHPQEIWVGPNEEKAITEIANGWPSLGGQLKTFVGQKFGGLEVRRMDVAGVAIR